jgi:hypothetical protein
MKGKEGRCVTLLYSVLGPIVLIAAALAVFYVVMPGGLGKSGGDDKAAVIRADTNGDQAPENKHTEGNTTARRHRRQVSKPPAKVPAPDKVDDNVDSEKPEINGADEAE